MNPVITEQLNKFKAGDFSGYEGFYNETVNTVYTMLHTIVNDQNVATSLVSQVYDKIYQNATSLEQTEGFYQWAAGFANEEALGYLKEHNLAGAISAAPESGKTPTEDLKRMASSDQGAASSDQMASPDQGAASPNQMALLGQGIAPAQVPSSAPESTEQFCDYAVGDEELMVTEAVVEDNAFVAKLQDIVGTLTPIERVIFQDYYYFGIGVPEIAAKTGCKDVDIRYTLSRTRTSIVQAITASPAYAAECGNPNVRRYRLAEAPWMWIAYQNFLGYTLGIDTVSIAGWSLGVLGQAAGSGIAIGGAGAAGVGAQGAAGAMAGAAAAGASGASGIAAGILGTIGGKIALGVIGAALATSIGFGVHHVVTTREPESVKQTVAPSVTEVAETTENTTETEETTVTTTEAMTQETTAAAVDESNDMGVSKIDYDKVAKEAYKEFLLSGLSTGTLPGKDGEELDAAQAYEFSIADIDGDGKVELDLRGEFFVTSGKYWGFAYTYNTDTKKVEVKYIPGYVTTYYTTGYVRSDSSHNQGPSSIWPYTLGKFENGELVWLYDLWNWDKSLHSDGFPDELDLDGDGCIYYIIDCATEETRTVDKPEYDAFIQGLNLGEEMKLDYKSYTTENVNAIQ